jgi:hypothetical protein
VPHHLRLAARVAVLLSIAMLIVAANISSPSFWLVAPAWLVLGIVGYLRFDESPDDSPYKKAVYVMAIPLLIYAGSWRSALFRFGDVLAQPSASNIGAFLSSRGFLVLLIIYLAVTCTFYREKVQKRDESLEIYKRAYKEQADAMKLK